MAEITKIQLKTKTSKNANGLWLKASTSCSCKLNNVDISLDTDWKRIEDISGSSFEIREITNGATVSYYTGETAPDAQAPGINYSNTVDQNFGKQLSEVNLDLGEPLFDTNTNHLFIKGDEVVEFPNKTYVDNQILTEANSRAAGDGRLKGYVDNFFGENSLESSDPFVAELSNVYSIDYSKPLVNHIGFVGGAQAWKNLDRVYKDSGGKYHCKLGLRDFSDVFESDYTTTNSGNAPFSVASDLLYYIPRAWKILTTALEYQVIKERYIIRNREAFLNGTLNIEIRFDKDAKSETKLMYHYITWSDVVGEYIPQFKLYYKEENTDTKLFLLMEARTNRTIEFIPVSIYNHPDIVSSYNEELFYTSYTEDNNTSTFTEEDVGSLEAESTHSASYPFAKIEPLGMSDDLNDEMYCKTGRWYFHNSKDRTWKNMPGSCINGWLETFQSPTTEKICDQIFHRAGSENNFYEIYTRTRFGSDEWSAWCRLATKEEIAATYLKLDGTSEMTGVLKVHGNYAQLRVINDNAIGEDESSSRTARVIAYSANQGIRLENYKADHKYRGISINTETDALDTAVRLVQATSDKPEDHKGYRIYGDHNIDYVKASMDSDGAVINETYAKKSGLTDGTIIVQKAASAEYAEYAHEGDRYTISSRLSMLEKERYLHQIVITSVGIALSFSVILSFNTELGSITGISASLYSDNVRTRIPASGWHGEAPVVGIIQAANNNALKCVHINGSTTSLMDSSFTDLSITDTVTQI